MQDNLKRTFIAVKIMPPADFINNYNIIKKKLQDEDIRWVKPGNFHITLRFLGDTFGQEIDKISEVLEKGLKDLKSFCFAVKGMDVFRSVRYPRVLWLGLTNTDDLQKLKSRVDEFLVSQGKVPDNNTFSPHLTLGRMKRMKDRETLREMINDYRNVEFFTVQVRTVLFFESILSMEGAAYKVISEYPLNHISP